MFILTRRTMQDALTLRRAHTITNFEEAVKTLYNLQSNAAYLQSVAKQGNRTDYMKLKETERYLLRCGITLERLDALSVIHVAGTKGKGSTCAFAESILRRHGFKTGFFSSPHLVTVRERIRINGQPITESYFTHYFKKVYGTLEETKEHESDMPTYFKFLTVLMFKIFLDMDIDVAIIEVGIGGEIDCTNVVRNPVCVGITSLGLEHTSLLGNTIEEIAFQKSGIFKKGTVAFTVPQPKQAMQVLEKRAMERDCVLHVVPPFEDYTWNNISPGIGISSHVQRQNASLAIQMAVTWITSHTEKLNSARNGLRSHNGFSRKSSHRVCRDKIASALSSCKWPGRTQILRSDNIDFYIDGAHTIDSIKSCVSWFESVASREPRYLIFNTSGERDSVGLLKLLKPLNFCKVYFVPNIANVSMIEDRLNSVLMSDQMPKCRKHCEVWGDGSVLGNNVSEVLSDIKKDTVKLNDVKIQVLVTGSLYLVGAVLAVLDPELTMSTNF